MCFHVKFLTFQWASDVVHHKDSIISPQIDLCILYAPGKTKKCLQPNMHCNLHLQLSQCTRVANLKTDLAGFCRSRFMHSHFHSSLAQRNCQEEIKWHAVWIEMPYATTHKVVLLLPNNEGMQKTKGLCLQY